MRTESEMGVLRLFWIGGSNGADGWRSVLAPEVELTVAGGPAEILSLLDDRPYALFGCGPAAVTAFEAARDLPAARPPACIVVAADIAPVEGEVSCPVVAFLPPGPHGDELTARWQDRTGGELAVRRLPPGFRERPGRETVLAVKEELRVWPR